MTKLIAAFALIVGFALPAAAADTYTTRLNLTLPAIGSAGWGVKVSSNFIDISTKVASLGDYNLFAASETHTNRFKVSSNTLTVDGTGAGMYTSGPSTAAYFYGDGSNLTGITVGAGAVDTTKLATDAVTTIKILDANVTSGKIATAAIGTTKIATDAVTTAKILDANVTNGKLAAAAVDTGKIATDAVTTVKILDANVTNGKIAAAAIDTGKLATDSVIGSKILNGTIDTAKLNATIQAQLASGSVSAGSIDTSKLATDAVTTIKILDANVTTGKIALGAVDTNRIATDAVTTIKIKDAAVDTTKIATDAVTTIKIKQGAVDTTKIGTDAVTTSKILDANVTNGKIAAAAVDTGKLSTDAVTNSKILDAQISYNKIGALGAPVGTAVCSTCTFENRGGSSLAGVTVTSMTAVLQIQLQPGATIHSAGTGQTNGTGVNLTTVTVGNYPQSDFMSVLMISSDIPCGYGAGISSMTIDFAQPMSSSYTYRFVWDAYGVTTTTGITALKFDHQNSPTGFYSFNNLSLESQAFQDSVNRGFCVFTSSAASTFGGKANIEQNSYHSISGRIVVNAVKPNVVSVNYFVSTQEEVTNFGTGQEGSWIGACRYKGPVTGAAPQQMTFWEPPTSLGQGQWCGRVRVYREP